MNSIFKKTKSREKFKIGASFPTGEFLKNTLFVLVFNDFLNFEMNKLNATNKIIVLFFIVRYSSAAAAHVAATVMF